MYERAFDTEWDNLSQEEAMFRAYALGVDTALGNEHEAELNSLMRAHHRGLVQIAYDEGKTRAEDALGDHRSGGKRGSTDDFEPGDREWEVWEQLVEDVDSDPDAFEPVEVSKSRLDLPSALDLPEFLDRPDTDTERIKIPRFLLR